MHLLLTPEWLRKPNTLPVGSFWTERSGVEASEMIVSVRVLRFLAALGMTRW